MPPSSSSPWLHGHAWISGAGSGIGKELAIAAARRGVAALSLVDLNKAAAEAVAADLRAAHPGLAVSVFVADVSSYEAVKAAVDDATGRHGPITALCVNAGLPCSGLFVEVAPEHGRKMFEVNYFGVQYTLAAALAAGPACMADPILDQVTGKPVRRAIMVTASAATHFSQPAAAHYSAAKYAVRGLLNSMRAEYVLQRKNLTFHILTPWYVKTPMIEFAHGSDPTRTPTLKAIQHHFIKDKDLIEPAVVARAAIRGVDRNKYLVTTDPASNLFADVGRAAGEPSRLPTILAVLLAPAMEIANVITGLVVDKELGKVLNGTPPTPWKGK